MATQVKEFKENLIRAYQPQEQAPVKSSIVTLGEVIGMIKMVLEAMIDSIDKAGNVGKDYLKTWLQEMQDSAKYRKKSAQDQATGSFRGAVIGIALTVVGMSGALKAMGNHAKNAGKMTEIQRAPIAEPPRNVGTGVQGKLMSEQDLVVDKRLADKGGMTASFEQSKVQDKANQKKVLHGKTDDATSYTSEKERERALKIQEKFNQESDSGAQFASSINAQSVPLGTVEDSRKKDDAAKAQHASDIKEAAKEAVKTLEGENKGFYGSLSGLMDKLGITHMVTQAIIAASQWK